MGEKRKMPVRSRRVELDGDFEGWWFEVRVNAPLGVLDDLSTGRYGLVIQALKRIVLDWNFVDEGGEPLGPGEDGYPTEELPMELYNKMATAFYEESAKLPPE